MPLNALFQTQFSHFKTPECVEFRLNELLMRVDGSLIVFTPFDPLFVIVSVFHNHAQKSFRQLDNCVDDANFPDLDKLLMRMNGVEVEMVCDYLSLCLELWIYFLVT